MLTLRAIGLNKSCFSPCKLTPLTVEGVKQVRSFSTDCLFSFAMPSESVGLSSLSFFSLDLEHFFRHCFATLLNFSRSLILLQPWVSKSPNYTNLSLTRQANGACKLVILVLRSESSIASSFIFYLVVRSALLASSIILLIYF